MTTSEEVPKIVEHEEDAKVDAKKKKLTGVVASINPYDSTLNTLVDAEGQIISTVRADGMHLLMAQARGNVGIKKGRYYYEVQILETANAFDLIIGVSTAQGKWAGGEHSVAFDQMTQIRSNGETSGKKALKSITKQDVLGVLLNMDPKATNKFSLSLFINGARASEPVPLPELMHKEALFPHIGFRGCTLGVNFQTIMKPLPFTVLMWQQAGHAEAEKSKIGRMETPKAVFPIGLETEAQIAKFLAENKNDAYLELTDAYMREWIKQSSLPMKGEKYGVACVDQPKLLAPWVKNRSQNILWALGNSLFQEERQKTLGYFPGFKKTALVCSIKIAPSGPVFSAFAQASLPTMEEEGLDHIIHTIPQDQAENELSEWKNDQRLRSKVDDLKVGTFFTERNSGWVKFVNEKKATNEGKAFSEEDWMLANIRHELVNIVHAFKEDVEDETRPSFPPQLATHYYKEYTKKQLDPLRFQCQSIEDLIKAHLSDSLMVDDKGLLSVKLDKEVDYESIFELVDKARDARETRVGAGDELSELKFSAKQVYTSMQQGGKGFSKGQKRPANLMTQYSSTQRRRI